MWKNYVFFFRTAFIRKYLIQTLLQFFRNNERREMGKFSAHNKVQLAHSRNHQVVQKMHKSFNWINFPCVKCTVDFTEYFLSAFFNNSFKELSAKWQVRKRILRHLLRYNYPFFKGICQWFRNSWIHCWGFDFSKFRSWALKPSPSFIVCFCSFLIPDKIINNAVEV